MSSIGDVALRAELLVRKYAKFDIKDERKADLGSTGDPFMDEYALIMSQVDDLNTRAAEAGAEKNRAVKAALNAELRRSKATLREDVTSRLQKQLRRPRGVAEEVVLSRQAKIQGALDAIDAVPDGTFGGIRKPVASGASGSAGSKGALRGTVNVSVDTFDERQRQSFYYEHSDETRQFTQDWQEARRRQDRQIDNIEKGLDTLRGLGAAMGDNLSQQAVLVNEVEEKLDEASRALSTSNMKLKGLVTKVRSTKLIIVDLVLLCVLLGIGLYIYNVVK